MIMKYNRNSRNTPSNYKLNQLGKLLTLFCIFMLLALVTANAQKGYKFGVKGGVNLTQLILSSIQQESSLPQLSAPVTAGYSVGLVIHLGLNDNIAFETGVELNKRNFGYRVDKENEVLKHRSYVYAWDLPLIVAHRNQIMTTKKPGRSIYLKKFVGTSLSILHSYDVDSTVMQGNESYDYSLEVFPGFEQSFLGGIAFELDSKRSQSVLSLGVSYHHSFKQVIQKNFTYNSVNGVTKANGQANGSYIAIHFTCLLPE